MIDWIIPEKINTPCMEDIENTSSPPLWASHRYLTSHLPDHPDFKSHTSLWWPIVLIGNLSETNVTKTNTKQQYI